MDTNLDEFKVKKKKRDYFLEAVTCKKDEENKNRSAIFSNLYYF